MSHSPTASSLALAVAGLFAASTAFAGDPATPAPGATATVKCQGINGCKGEGACHTATNSCAGQNACKGTAWIKVETEKVCTDKGGTVVKDPPAEPAKPAAPAPAK